MVEATEKENPYQQEGLLEKAKVEEPKESTPELQHNEIPNEVGEEEEKKAVVEPVMVPKFVYV